MATVGVSEAGLFGRAEEKWPELQSETGRAIISISIQSNTPGVGGGTSPPGLVCHHYLNTRLVEESLD